MKKTISLENRFKVQKGNGFLNLQLAESVGTESPALYGGVNLGKQSRNIPVKCAAERNIVGGVIRAEYGALAVDVLKEECHFFKNSIRSFQRVEFAGFPLVMEGRARLDEQGQKAGIFRFNGGNDFGGLYRMFFQIFNAAETGNQCNRRFKSCGL